MSCWCLFEAPRLAGPGLLWPGLLRWSRDFELTAAGSLSFAEFAGGLHSREVAAHARSVPRATARASLREQAAARIRTLCTVCSPTPGPGGPGRITRGRCLNPRSLSSGILPVSFDQCALSSPSKRPPQPPPSSFAGISVWIDEHHVHLFAQRITALVERDDSDGSLISAVRAPR
jgi:hypothetical protein